MKSMFALIVSLSCAATSMNGQISSGGQFTLEQSAIAAGGGTSSSASLVVSGTNGQAAAGIRTPVSSLLLQNGFWTSAPLVPTAAGVAISGRVTRANGIGISGATIVMTRADGTTSAARSSSLGYYQFDDIEAGQTVMLSITSRSFTFSVSVLVLSPHEDLTDIDFVANE
jgi:hypothetical protein